MPGNAIAVWRGRGGEAGSPQNASRLTSCRANRNGRRVTPAKPGEPASLANPLCTSKYTGACRCSGSFGQDGICAVASRRVHLATTLTVWFGFGSFGQNGRVAAAVRGLGSFSRNCFGRFTRSRVRLAKPVLVGLHCLGFVRRYSEAVADVAWVRLADMHTGLRRVGFVRPRRVAPTRTHEVRLAKVLQLAPARVAKETGDPPGLLIGLRVRVRQTETPSPVGGPGRSPALRTARMTVGFRAAPPQSHFP
jgi:hypothetical protein